MNTLILEFATVPAVAEDGGGFEIHTFNLSLVFFISGAALSAVCLNVK